MVELVPSCPFQLAPQQYAAFPVVTAHAWLPLALTERKMSPPDTGTGVLVPLK
jgi:hypothetical protein